MKLPGARALALGLLAVPLACVSPYPRGPVADGPREPAPRAPAPDPAVLALSPIRVRLTAWDGVERFVVNTPQGTRTFTAAPGGEVLGDGGQRSPAFVLPARATGWLHHVGGRAYPGALRVEPRTGGGLRVTCSLPLEDYVEGVVAAELSIWSAEPAELEAQAIAARSYALAALVERTREGSEAVLLDDVRDQAYRGIYVPGSGAGAQRVAERLRAAVRTTRGRVLVAEGRVLDARFHASCGGRTAPFQAVFPRARPAPIAPTTCGPCIAIGSTERTAAQEASYTGRVAWRWRAEPDDLDALARELGIGPRLESLRPLQRDGDGRWRSVALEGTGGRRSLTMLELRERLGPDRLRGARVVATVPADGAPLDAGLVFEGLGRGHGVGLCQEGARERARQGWSAELILAGYYPSARVVPLSRLSRDAAPDA